MNSPPGRHVSVVCPACGARLEERLDKSPRTITCPDCSAPVRVPSLADENAGQEPRSDTYRLQSNAPLPADEPAKNRQPLVAVVTCPVCRRQLRCKPRREPSCTDCPDCGEPVRVPSRAVVRKQHQENRPPPTPARSASKGFDPHQQPSPSRDVTTDYWETRAALRVVEDTPEPPRWTFFTDVWLFVFHREMLSRWFFLSLGIVALAALLLGVGAVFNGASGYMGVAVAFFILPAIWIGVWTGSYAASCWLVILEDTAGGNRTIHNWHQQNWREWVVHAMYVSYLLTVALVVGHGFGKLAELAGLDYWLVLPLTVVLLFPIVALSSMQSTDWWSPLTMPILTSLWSEFRGWVLFYLLTGGLILAGGFCCWAGFAISPLFTLPFTAPILAAAWFTYGRLLGRLGWLISRERGEDERPAGNF